MAFLWFPLVDSVSTGAITPLLVVLAALAWRYRDSSTHRRCVSALPYPLASAVVLVV